jgi:hypothetical protein
MARALLKQRGMPAVFWGEAVVTAVYILNRSPTKALNGMTPYEAWNGRKLAVSHLRVFGCLAFTIEYVHFKGAGGVGNSSPSRSTPAPKSPPTPVPNSPAPATTSSSPPHTPATTQATASSSPPRTPAPTVPSPGTSSPTPARVEHDPVELVTPLSRDKERVDACYDGESLRYRRVEGLLIDPSVPGPASRILAGELHLACDDGEPRSFTEAEKHAAWRAAM